jgi:lytic murein transglycosylase
MIPRCFALALLLVASLAPLAKAQSAKPNSVQFDQFVADLWNDAQGQGISRVTFVRAFDGVTPDPRVIAATKRQPEYNKPAGAYINQIASAGNAAEGRKKELQWRPTFDAIEKKYQVERWLILAIWGMETSYGALRDKWDGIRSLATLAFVKYRDPLFRNELLAALKIIQDGHIARQKFVSSWAGAMGQTQFMPTTFAKYAVDFDGDGKRDIWTNIPDAMASTANYLATAADGWKMGVPWGFEVIVPQGFDLMKSRASFDEWRALGVRRADGNAFPLTGSGILFFPAGAPGPAFIVTPNFDVIKDYNDSDVYALAIGHLSDLMQGSGSFKTSWPTQGTQLPRDDRIVLQRKLAELRYDQTRFSGHIDFKMRDFVRIEQKKHGLTTDGHPTAALLRELGVKTTASR